MMKNILKKIIVIATMLTVFSCHANPPCSDNLFDNIDVEKSLNMAGLEKPYLLNKVGMVEGEGNCFLIYYYEKEFGNKRLTKRLVIIPSKSGDFGLYDIPETPYEIKNKSVHFKLQEETGNQINLNISELPKSIYLDAEIYDLDSYKKIMK
jgi:hypothetical protein